MASITRRIGREPLYNIKQPAGTSFTRFQDLPAELQSRILFLSLQLTGYDTVVGYQYSMEYEEWLAAYVLPLLHTSNPIRKECLHLLAKRHIWRFSGNIPDIVHFLKFMKSAGVLGDVGDVYLELGVIV